jgi:alanine racemase
MLMKEVNEIVGEARADRANDVNRNRSIWFGREKRAMERREFLYALGAGSLAVLPDPKPVINKEIVESRASSDLSGRRDPRIDVSFENLFWNFARVKMRAKVPVMAVVKANAYGHGLVETARALEKTGAAALMVGKLAEAVSLREAGVRLPILNFGPFARGDSEAIVARRINQAVYSDEVRYLDESASRLNTKASVHIDIDTGMGRTGVPHDRALALIEKIGSLASLKIAGVCTSLTEDLEFDREQMKRFLDVCEAAKVRGISLGVRHAASSAALFEAPEYFLDMIRPGIALYGYYPNARTAKEDALGLKPVLKLSATVILIKDLAPGESLSYLRSFKAKDRMRVATVGVGYADGYPAQMGGRAVVAIKHKIFPVLPAVTANHTMVDLLNDREIEVGDEAVLIDREKGRGLTADALAEKTGVGDYKLLIGLNPSLPRIYF